VEFVLSMRLRKLSDYKCGLLIALFFLLTSCHDFEQGNNMKKKELKIIGWREWVALPDLGVKKIKAKVDSGARTSSLHAFDIKQYTRNGKQYVRFFVHPNQRNSDDEIECTSKVLEFRKVKSSNGQTELRPVILTRVSLQDESWEVEMTLTNRDEMGFRMLLGRESIRKRFLIDTGKSFLGTKKVKKKVNKKIKKMVKKK